MRGRQSLRACGLRQATGRMRRAGMFDIRDLFQWERFITPSIIRVFFWLAFFVALVAGAFLVVILSVSGACLAVLSARLAAEFVLITFRVNDHLGALRSRAEM